MRSRFPEVPLTQDPPPEYTVGDRVVYRGREDNVWKINSIDQGVNCWWVRASQNSVTQCFPAAVFAKPVIEVHRAAPIEQPKIRMKA